MDTYQRTVDGLDPGIAPGAEEQPPGQATHSLDRSKRMVAPSPVIPALVNGQEIPCLFHTGSEIPGI